MPYSFTFDLSSLPCGVYSEIALISHNKKMQKNYIKKLQILISSYGIQQAAGLNSSDAVVLLGDMLNLQKINNRERKKFVQTKKRVLFLPHCARKNMDNNCKAVFNVDIPAYKCAHCSPDCSVNKADRLAKEKGYDVYILPGASCIPKILKAHNYDGIVGVACGEEIKSMGLLLRKLGIAGQAVPLIKNGCARTIFNIETLLEVL
jgi:uncharacterized protein